MVMLYVLQLLAIMMQAKHPTYLVHALRVDGAIRGRSEHSILHALGGKERERERERARASRGVAVHRSPHPSLVALTR